MHVEVRRGAARFGPRGWSISAGSGRVAISGGPAPAGRPSLAGSVWQAQFGRLSLAGSVQWGQTRHRAMPRARRMPGALNRALGYSQGRWRKVPSRRSVPARDRLQCVVQRAAFPKVSAGPEKRIEAGENESSRGPSAGERWAFLRSRTPCQKGRHPADQEVAGPRTHQKSAHPICPGDAKKVDLGPNVDWPSVFSP